MDWRLLIGVNLVIFIAVLVYIYFKTPVATAAEEKLDPFLEPAIYEHAADDEPDKQGGEKRIVWIMHSYVPNVRAGSEITAEDQIRFLKKQGWTIYVLVHRWVVPEHEGVKIFPIRKGQVTQSKGIRRLLQQADIVCVQNYSINELDLQIQEFGKPLVVFLHTQNDNREVLNFRLGTPAYVVYNVNFLKLESNNTHPSIVIHPKIDSEKFKIPKKDARYVTLINTNDNKGGNLLPKLAAALPEIQFLGVKGGYSNQIVDKNPPPNLKYIENQSDMTHVYEETKVLIMPSKSETWGRVAVEAMAGGTPVVVSRSPGLLECVGKAVNACDRSDISCWTERIQTLMTDDKAYAEAKNKSLARVKELESEDEYNRLNTFLEDIRNRHK